MHIHDWVQVNSFKNQVSSRLLLSAERQASCFHNLYLPRMGCNDAACLGVRWRPFSVRFDKVSQNAPKKIRIIGIYFYIVY
jgi:hypothetical protein